MVRVSGLGRVCLSSHVLCSPRACGGLPAQWHHHWGRLELSGGMGLGVRWEEWAEQSKMEKQGSRRPSNHPQGSSVS